MADRNAVVVAIGSAEERQIRRLATYFRFLRIDLPLACDADGRVGGLIRPAGPDTGEQNLRVTYVIDEDGLVKDFHHNELSSFQPLALGAADAGRPPLTTRHPRRRIDLSLC